MAIPTNTEIFALLDQLNVSVADDLETQWLDFKPWQNPKAAMNIAIEYTVCFANSDGGVIVFGIADRMRGRAAAIHGASGYKLDLWRRNIFDATRPNVTVEVEELPVPEGTGKLLLVQVPKGSNPPYGTAQGLFKKRIGKNCMPMDPQGFALARISTGVVDWSGQPAEDVRFEDLDAVEIARARNILRRINAESELLKLDDYGFLVGVGAIRRGNVTRTGLLLFGQEQQLGLKSRAISGSGPERMASYDERAPGDLMCDIFRGRRTRKKGRWEF
jgi:ATP-dependent DNA helicase RecG